MKTITIRLTNADGLDAEVRGTFTTLPGQGKVEWTGKAELEALLKPPYSAPLPDYHFAETFEAAITALAKHHGWAVESVRRVGDWEVFTE